MNAIPPAALAVIRAAAEDYRLITPAEETTPAGVASRIAQYLISSGYEIRPSAQSVVKAKPRSPAPRGDCPRCGRDYALTLEGRIRQHDIPGRDVPCRGSRRPPVPGSATHRAQAPVPTPARANRRPPCSA
ncbi:hypothetical protein [Streptomyces antimycoticus]|uniref:hypothetical protein n=1 Tax=Streptomyces antimycoticus TaxID=68175 RepID=UPI000A3721F2|nr:hypothetical protein [Streptomyces antimycoticus]